MAAGARKISGHPFWLLYPYKHSFPDVALRKAFDASENFESTEFKSLRAEIVGYFQHQYDRIVSASRHLVSAIKDEKVEDGFLDPCSTQNSWKELSHEDFMRIARLVILVEGYAAAFERDKDSTTEEEFRLGKRSIDNLRMEYPREMKLQKLDRILEEKRCDSFKDAFQDLVNDLGRQFSDIRQAWGDLFKDDVDPNTMCDIQY